MKILESIVKSRDLSLLTKVHIVKVMVFPVVMYGCEICTIKKTELRGTDAFVCSAGEDSWSNLSLLKEINPEYPLGGLMLNPKLLSCPLDRKNRLTGKDPDAGENWRQKENTVAENDMVK